MRLGPPDWHIRVSSPVSVHPGIPFAELADSTRSNGGWTCIHASIPTPRNPLADYGIKPKRIRHAPNQGIVFVYLFFVSLAPLLGAVTGSFAFSAFLRFLPRSKTSRTTR